MSEKIVVIDGDDADFIMKAALGIEETIVVSRERLTVALHELLERLPDMLAENAESMPIYARAALPVVRMLLASNEMQETLSGEGIVSAVWEALNKCQ